MRRRFFYDYHDRSKETLTRTSFNHSFLTLKTTMKTTMTNNCNMMQNRVLTECSVQHTLSMLDFKLFPSTPFRLCLIRKIFLLYSSHQTLVTQAILKKKFQLFPVVTFYLFASLSGKVYYNLFGSTFSWRTAVLNTGYSILHSSSIQ